MDDQKSGDSLMRLLGEIKYNVDQLIQNLHYFDSTDKKNE